MIQTEVLQTVWVGDRFVELRLKRPDHYSYEPGQHCTLLYTDAQGKFERIYSIASAPFQFNELVFCIQASTDSRALHVLKNLHPGSLLGLGNARGNFRLRSSSRRALFIAGGSGIAPMRSFLLHLTQSGPVASGATDRPVLLFGCRNAEEIPFFEEWKGLPIDVRISAATGTRDQVRSGSVLELLEELKGEFKEEFRGEFTGEIKDEFKGQLSQFEASYLCGSPPMIEAVRKWLEGAGFKAENIVVEQY